MVIGYQQPTSRFSVFSYAIGWVMWWIYSPFKMQIYFSGCFLPFSFPYEVFIAAFWSFVEVWNITKSSGNKLVSKKVKNNWSLSDVLAPSHLILLILYLWCFCFRSERELVIKPLRTFSDSSVQDWFWWCNRESTDIHC